MTREVPTIRARKIDIRPSKSYRRSLRDGRTDIVLFAWTKAPAFAVNSRGKLIHRVRHVTTIIWNGKESHYHADYLCGNGCNFDLYLAAETLVADPPHDRLLCENCELRAKRERKLSGDTLARRHVHRGVLVPRQTCCGSEP